MQQVEVKRLILTGNTKLIGLKRRQYEELMDIRKSGGISFVIVYAEWGNNRYLYRILDVSDADKTRLDPNDPRILSVNVTRIATWDISYLLFDDVGSFHRAMDTATGST
jgi:penicillin-binding protein-related factor A (putative recombinase)